jgi:hypothetical protein
MDAGMGVACIGGGVGCTCGAVALRRSARLLEFRNDGVLGGGPCTEACWYG